MDPSNSNGGKSPWNYSLSGKIMLSAIVLLFTVVLLILFLHLYVRWHIIRRASRQAQRRRRLVFSGETHSATSAAVNRGLDPSIVASLAVLLFSDNEEDDESAECAVCLNEFEEGEKIRRLPDCAHRFHVDCIDMWFCSHSTCPLCRTAVKETTVVRASGRLQTENSIDPDSSNNELVSSNRVVEADVGSGSGLQEVRIDVPETRTSGQEEEEQDREIVRRVLKLPISRMVLIRWFMMLDPRNNRSNISESDLESGDRREFQPNSVAAIAMNGGNTTNR